MLVVDDNATNRRILQEMLASWHMTPTTVADAESALDALRLAVAGTKPFDAIISDRQMPGVDGFMLARRVRREQPLATTPIVMLMSVGDAGEAAGRGVAIDAYLTKPVKHSDLLDALATLVSACRREARGLNARSGRAATPAQPLADPARRRQSRSTGSSSRRCCRSAGIRSMLSRTVAPRSI